MSARECDLHGAGSERGETLRILVLDGSRIMASLVRRLTPEGVDVEEARTFNDAMSCLRERPPDAVILNVGPADLPWQDLKRYCRDREPPIPVLYESCVYRTPDEAGIDNLGHSAQFLSKPYGLQDLRQELERLLGRGRRASGEGADRGQDEALRKGARPRP